MPTESPASTALPDPIIEHALDAVISMDQTGTIIQWNRQAEKIFGWSRDEALGKTVESLIIPPAYRKRHRHGMRRYMKDGRANILDRHVEMEALDRRGEIFPIELTVTAYKIKSRHYFIAFIRDITERKRMEEALISHGRKLEKSNQELEDFAQVVAHDLKEPLRGIETIARSLLDEDADKLDTAAIGKIRRMIELGRHISNMITDLLHFSRLGYIDSAPQEINPAGIVADIKMTLADLLREKHARIVVEQPMPRIVCNKAWVTEIFRNLIINGIKHNDKPERLVEVGFIDSLQTPHGLEENIFYVRDNGIGIDPRLHQEVFRIFKKIPHPAVCDSGTGAGLACVRRIIDRSHGHIWIDSDLGKGTTFYFTLGPTPPCAGACT